ncbi:hypothetical protein C0J52_06425 [Blattella germanica]|nr:hypothetical protein C0J52_06425 [Blattella germanica]
MVHESEAVPPSVMWAQRNNVIFLTICLEDCKNPNIKIDNDKIYFYGVGGTEKKKHEVTIPLFKEIDPEMMRQMGGLGGGGGDSKPSFDYLEPESDSDDEELPDLE